MPNKALPLTYLNLGGEMVYVVEQRLNGQKIELTKRKKSIPLNIYTEFTKLIFNRILLGVLFDIWDNFLIKVSFKTFNCYCFNQNKVINGLIMNMFNQKLIEKIFSEEALWSRKAFFVLFCKLLNLSKLELDKDSMEKVKCEFLFLLLNYPKLLNFSPEVNLI